MKRLIYFFPLVFVVSCAAPPPVKGPAPPPAPTPEKTGALEGEWREVRNQGKPVRARKIWTFAGDTVTIDDGKKVYRGTFTLDEAAEPKQIDFIFEGFPVNRGLYALKGNVLRLKLLDTAMERPVKLGPENGYRVIVCRRKNPPPEKEAEK